MGGDVEKYIFQHPLNLFTASLALPQTSKRRCSLESQGGWQGCATDTFVKPLEKKRSPHTPFRLQMSLFVLITHSSKRTFVHLRLRGAGTAVVAAEGNDEGRGGIFNVISMGL